MAHPSQPDEAPPDLNHAGAVVDQAIEYMISQQIGSLPIASALLGGALGLMARTMDQDAMIRVLRNAIESTSRGDLHRMDRKE